LKENFPIHPTQKGSAGSQMSGSAVVVVIVVGVGVCIAGGAVVPDLVTTVSGLD